MRVCLVVPALFRVIYKNLLCLRLGGVALLAVLTPPPPCAQWFGLDLWDTVDLFDAGDVALARLASPINHLLESPPCKRRVPSTLAATQPICVRVVWRFCMVK